MNLIGHVVKHQAFGIGVITHFREPYISVSFTCGQKDFVYPEAFRKYLAFTDQSDQREVESLLIRVEESPTQESPSRKGFLHTPNIPVDDYIEITVAKSESTLLKRKHGRRSQGLDSANLAFKCVFCDGGLSDQEAGFCGVCSPELIRHNVKKSKLNHCRLDDKLCAAYVRGETSYENLKGAWEDGHFDCESTVLRDWRIRTGLADICDVRNRPARLRTNVASKLAILTTRQSDQDESARRIFAVFLIDKAMQQYDDFSFIYADPTYRLQLTPDESARMPYWAYHANDQKAARPAWGSGLYRYIPDAEAMRILWDIAVIKMRTDDADFALDFFHHYCSINALDSEEVPEAQGALSRSLRS